MRLLSTKSTLLFGIGVLTLSACRKEEVEIEPGLPEYADWYAVRSPEGRAIEAVYGDLDSTLVISTLFKIYQTKDRGKTWLTSNYNAAHAVEGFLMRNDTLLTLTATATGVGTAPGTSYATSPLDYSVDKGATWKPYRDWTRRAFEPRVALSVATSPAGVEYSIDELRTPVRPGSTSYYVETVGVKSSTGSKLTLPHDHVITSICFDTRARLYVTASAALCGRRENFAYCGKPNGILYVSKKSQP
jgi:hypothetical protein